MSTQESLEFDAEWDRITDLADAVAQLHAHTEPSCRFCDNANGATAKAAATAAVKRDLAWWDEAVTWLAQLPSGFEFTADDLVAGCGKPWGSPNQIGARLRSWSFSNEIHPVGVAEACRAESHGRLLRLWAVA